MAVDPAQIKRPRKAAKAAEGDEKSLFERIKERAAAANAGKPRFTRTSALNTLIGMPTPSLAFSWLLQCNVVPFSRAVQVVGPPGTGKTMLQTDLLRGLLGLGEPIPGQALYCENENKPSLTLFWSLLENRRDLEGHVINIAYTRLMNAWMQAMAAKVKEWRTLFDPECKQGDQFGWRVPLFLGLDSLMSTMSAESFGKFEDAGDFGRQFPVEAMMLAQFGRALPNLIGGRPILLVATNHFKPFTDPQGNVKRNIPGGQAFAYMESLEFELARAGEIGTNKREGIKVAVKAFKNCVGTSRRRLVVDVVWEYDAADPTASDRERTQWTMFDWQGASIRLLRGIKAEDRARWERVDEIVDIHDARGGQGYGWSNALGVPSSDPATIHELGCLLEERPDLLEALYPVLDIRQGRFFEPGMDYQEMLADEDARPSPQADRVFRRPACGDLSRALAAGEIDLAGAAA